MSSAPVRDFLSNNGDWAVINGDFSTASGQVAVVQLITIALQFFLGECFIDQTVGTDYLGKINIKNPDPLVVRAVLQTRIADVPDVTAVYGADLVQNGRDAQIAYVADSVYSTNPFSNSVAVR